jgi:hypothetical protein
MRQIYLPFHILAISNVTDPETGERYCHVITDDTSPTYMENGQLTEAHGTVPEKWQRDGVPMHEYYKVPQDLATEVKAVTPPDVKLEPSK